MRIGQEGNKKRLTHERDGAKEETKLLNEVR
jgi:hypothetical protein